MVERRRQGEEELKKAHVKRHPVVPALAMRAQNPVKVSGQYVVGTVQVTLLIHLFRVCRKAEFCADKGAMLDMRFMQASC